MTSGREHRSHGEAAGEGVVDSGAGESLRGLYKPVAEEVVAYEVVRTGDFATLPMDYHSKVNSAACTHDSHCYLFSAS